MARFTTDSEGYIQAIEDDDAAGGAGGSRETVPAKGTPLHRPAAVPQSLIYRMSHSQTKECYIGRLKVRSGAPERQIKAVHRARPSALRDWMQQAEEQGQLVVEILARVPVSEASKSEDQAIDEHRASGAWTVLNTRKAGAIDEHMRFLRVVQQAMQSIFAVAPALMKVRQDPFDRVAVLYVRVESRTYAVRDAEECRTVMRALFDAAVARGEPGWPGSSLAVRAERRAGGGE